MSAPQKEQSRWCLHHVRGDLDHSALRTLPTRRVAWGARTGVAGGRPVLCRDAGLAFQTIFLFSFSHLFPLLFHYLCQLSPSSFHESIKLIRSRAVLLERGESENQREAPAALALSIPPSGSGGWNLAAMLQPCSPFLGWRRDEVEPDACAHAATPGATVEQMRRRAGRVVLHGAGAFVPAGAA